jgi:protein TonB
MLAYAAHRRTVAGQRPAPHAFLVIIVAHIALIATVMSAKMDLPQRLRDVTKVKLIPAPPLPPPKPQSQPKADPKPSESTLDQVPRVVPVPQPPRDPVDGTAVPAPRDPVIGPTIVPQPPVEPLLQPPIERVGPRFDTPAWAVRPPYPSSKIASGEEAALRLKLAIDERGRVVAVEPVGKADAAFLAAARRHLLSRWRYKPATEGGRAIASSTLITLRFELAE